MDIFIDIFTNYWLYIWLALVPIIIFSVSPKTAKWIRSVRIVGLMILLLVLGKINVVINSQPKGPSYGGDYDFEYYTIEILQIIWIMVLFNMYVGWWEIIWKTFYKQWSLDFTFIKKYGMISFISVFLSIILTILFVFFFLFLFITSL